MNRIIATTFALALTMGSAGIASAQSHEGDRGQPQDRHDNRLQTQGDHRGDQPAPQQRHHWAKGQKIEHSDWDRGQHIDYRQHHLRAPPRGYEWRQVDDQYILAAVATGVIASIIANAH